MTAKPDYLIVTETPETLGTSEALSMAFTRYWYAAGRCAGKDVLEVACGAGQGLGCLARLGRRVIGGDYSQNLIRIARRHYQARIPLVCLDANALPFKPRSFDVVILFEAIYYLASPERFLQQCAAVLRTGGRVLLCTVNREWKDFNPSPFHTRYFSAAELSSLLARHGFAAEIQGAFLVPGESLGTRLVSLLKRTAILLGLMPRTMKGKAWLKRIFLGPLTAMPAELHDGIAQYDEPKPLSDASQASRFKILFAAGELLTQ